MAVANYKKTLNNFCSAEWKCLGLTVGLEKNQFSGKRKNQVIKMVLTKQPKLLDTPENFYYFNQTGQGIKMISDEPQNKESYLESKINYSWHLSTAQLREIMTKEEEKEDETKAEPDDSTVSSIERDSLQGDQEQSDLVKITSMLENLTSQSVTKVSKLVTPKIKYDSNIEIRRFLGQVETYASANSISSDSNLIAIALAAMDQSDEGSLVKETLEDKDRDLGKF